MRRKRLARPLFSLLLLLAVLVVVSAGLPPFAARAAVFDSFAKAVAPDARGGPDVAPSALLAASAAGVYVTPGRGSADRQAIMNAARVPVVRDIGQQIVFVVQVLRTDGQWAYLQATPVQPDGRPLDWTRTRLAADWRADAMSDIVMVLLARRGGRWQVVDHVVGPTDVFWYSWTDRYGLPDALFHN